MMSYKKRKKYENLLKTNGYLYVKIKKVNRIFDLQNKV